MWKDSEPAWKDGTIYALKKKKRIVFDSRIFHCYILECIKDTKKKKLWQMEGKNPFYIEAWQLIKKDKTIELENHLLVTPSVIN